MRPLLANLCIRLRFFSSPYSRGLQYAKIAKELGEIAYGNQSDEAKVFESICQQWNSTPPSDLFSVVQESISKLRDIV